MTTQERINACPNNRVPVIKGDRVDYVWPKDADQYVKQHGYTLAVKTEAPVEVEDAISVRILNGDESFDGILSLQGEPKKPGRKPKGIEQEETTEQ